MHLQLNPVKIHLNLDPLSARGSLMRFVIFHCLLIELFVLDFQGKYMTPVPACNDFYCPTAAWIILELFDFQ